MNTRYPSIWLKNGSKIFEMELQWISGYKLVRNSLFFVFFVFFTCSSCSWCVLCLWRFVVEVLRGFRGLNPLSFTDLWFVEVSRGFWAWFQWTLRSRQVVWMILLRMFFVFEGLWWKFFGALEAWIRRASPICGLLRVLEAFELDSSDLRI